MTGPDVSLMSRVISVWARLGPTKRRRINKYSPDFFMATNWSSKLAGQLSFSATSPQYPLPLDQARWPRFPFLWRPAFFLICTTHSPPYLASPHRVLSAVGLF